VEKDLIIARKFIKAGDEVVYDYCTTQGNTVMNMECRCGTALCRGRIRGDDWKIKELQERYKGHFLPYIQKRINNQT